MNARILLASLISTLLFTASSLPAQEQGLVVHEWGTFTTIQGSDGGTLSGLYIEEEALPQFVYQLAGFPTNQTHSSKGIYQPVVGATVKMETPVLYFYSKSRRDVSVHVDFEHGTISQWYPQRSDGELYNPLDTYNLTNSPHGWIEWNATILPPGDSTPLSSRKELETPTWTAPRATDANLVQINQETEKFLFYRGLGNHSFPLRTSFNGDSTLVLTNSSREPFPYLFVYDRTDSGNPVVWWTGRLEAGESRSLMPATEPLDGKTLAAKFKEFEDALVDAGLYRKEAAAMLETWNRSYFGTSGLRVFWIVPRSLTDQILPISITPTPDDLQRVLVGRSEVLTPGFEKEMVKEFAAHGGGKWSNDEYLPAYQERYLQLTQGSSVQAPETNDGVAIAVNSKEGLCEIQTRIERAGSVRLRLVNILGRRVFSLEENAEPGTYRREIDTKDLPAGIYFLTVQNGTQQWSRKLVKE